MSNLKSDRRGGFYFKDGVSHLSVTTILKAISKPALVPWAAAEVWAEMVKNPNIALEEARLIPQVASKKAMARGVTVHSLIEAFRKNDIVAGFVPGEFGLYYQSFKSWVEDYRPEFIFQEETFFDNEHKIAGTTDGGILLEGKNYLVDFKTNKDGNVYKETALQLSAYARMVRRSGKTVDGIMAVGLSDHGTYKMEKLNENFDIFLKVKDLYCWLNKDALEKVGYETN